MNGRSKINERLYEMTPNKLLFNVSVSPKKTKNLNKDTTNI